MTALGEDVANAVGLVYVAACGIDQGESLGGLLSQGPFRPRSSTRWWMNGLRVAVRE